MQDGIDISYIAASDLSAKRFYFVKLTTTAGKVDVCAGTTDFPIGILQNNPVSGKAALVRIFGISQVSADAVLAAGDVVGTSADGQAAVYVAGTDTTKYLKGVVTKAATLVDQIAEILLIPIARGA